MHILVSQKKIGNGKDKWSLSESEDGEKEREAMRVNYIS